MSAMTFEEAYQRANGYATRIWDTEGKSTLHSMLVDLRKAHEEEVATARDAFPLGLPTYDVAGNERHKAACRLRDWDPSYVAEQNWDKDDVQIRVLYQVLDIGGGTGVEGVEAAKAVRDKLVELLES